MEGDLKQRFLGHVNILIEEGRSVLRTEWSPSGIFDMNAPYVDTPVFSKWLTSCRNLVATIGKAATVWVDAFGGSRHNTLGTAKSLLGSLESLKEAFENDLLAGIEGLVMADAFGSLLDQARHLLQNGYSLAAGVLGRAVLEEHLVSMCQYYLCVVSAKPTINDLNQALYKGGQLDKLAMQSVTAMATAGNHCAHNEHPALSRSDVERF